MREHFMTSEELAELFHVDPVTIRRLGTNSELCTYRIGANYCFAPSDLQDYLAPSAPQGKEGSL